MNRPNPFSLSTCAKFVVERHEGERFPNVMTLDEAVYRARRCERDGANYEAEADAARIGGNLPSMEYCLGFARVHLTIAAEIAEALGGSVDRKVG